MSDADLERIRQQRMAQMQSQFVSEFSIEFVDFDVNITFPHIFSRWVNFTSCFDFKR